MARGAPRRNPPKQAWAIHKEQPELHTARPKLTEQDMEQLAKLMREKYGWDSDPRPFQLAGVRAQIEGVDTIIQAPTGSGKTAVAAGPHLWPGNANKVTIMVSPLLALEDEMVHTFQKDFGLHAIAINSQNGSCSIDVAKKIVSGKYQIVLASPEMLQSRTFINWVLRQPSFVRKVISLFVDEAHCISHWGADFRKKYSSLGIIHAFLPRHTPVVAVTATLTARVRRDIQSKLHFPKMGSRFVNVGNDRPNVTIVVRAAEHPMNSFADLNFVLPSILGSPTDIPKTYIYVDNINVGTEIVDYLVNKIQSQPWNDPLEPSLPPTIVRPYNATLSHEYKVAAMEKFRSGEIRILVCTDAAGMGCNIPDIDIVVQWKLPLTLSNFIQRAGRAARGHGRTGIAVLIAERSAYSVNLSSSGSDIVDVPTSRKPRGRGKVKNKQENKGCKSTTEAKTAKEYALAHGIDHGGTSKNDSIPTGQQPAVSPDASDEGLLVFVQSVQCRRQVWAHVFESPLNTSPIVPCCDICHPSELTRTRPGTILQDPKAKTRHKGMPDLEVKHHLHSWREAVFQRDHAHAQFDSTSILDDSVIEQLCTGGPISAHSLAMLLKPTWHWWDSHGQELTALMLSLDITYTPRRRKTKVQQPSGPLNASMNVQNVTRTQSTVNVIADTQLAHDTRHGQVLVLPGSKHLPETVTPKKRPHEDTIHDDPSVPIAVSRTSGPSRKKSHTRNPASHRITNPESTTSDMSSVSSQAASTPFAQASQSSLSHAHAVPASVASNIPRLLHPSPQIPRTTELTGSASRTLGTYRPTHPSGGSTKHADSRAADKPPSYDDFWASFSQARR